MKFWYLYHSYTDPEGAGSLDPPRKSHVAIGFLRNTGADSSREAIEPH